MSARTSRCVERMNSVRTQMDRIDAQASYTDFIFLTSAYKGGQSGMVSHRQCTVGVLVAAEFYYAAPCLYRCEFCSLEWSPCFTVLRVHILFQPNLFRSDKVGSVNAPEQIVLKGRLCKLHKSLK